MSDGPEIQSSNRLHVSVRGGRARPCLQSAVSLRDRRPSLTPRFLVSPWSFVALAVPGRMRWKRPMTCGCWGYTTKDQGPRTKCLQSAPTAPAAATGRQAVRGPAGSFPAGRLRSVGAATNGSGLIRSPRPMATNWSTGDIVNILGVLGTTEANGSWTVTVISMTTADLQGSTFSNTYSSVAMRRGDVVTIVAGDTVNVDTVSEAAGQLHRRLGPEHGRAAAITIQAGAGGRPCARRQQASRSGSATRSSRTATTVGFAAATLTLAAGCLTDLRREPGAAGNMAIQLTKDGSSPTERRARIARSRPDHARRQRRRCRPMREMGAARSRRRQGLPLNGGLVTVRYTDFSNFGTAGTNILGLFTYLENIYAFH